MAKPNYRKKVEVIVIKEGKVCVCLPSPGREFYGFPGGGIDPGETLEQAAKRECLEEVGFAVTDVQSLNAGEVFLSGTKAKKLGFDGSQVFYYMAAYGSDNRSIYNIEGDGRDVEWMDIDKAIQIYSAAKTPFDDSRASILKLIKLKHKNFLNTH